MKGDIVLTAGSVAKAATNRKNMLFLSIEVVSKVVNTLLFRQNIPLITVKTTSSE